jgi:hypothetical protein
MQTEHQGGDMNAEDKREIEAIFKHHIGVLVESFQHKLDIVVEGHEVLRQENREVRDESNAKHEQTAFLLRALNDKVDGVENRLSAKFDSVAGDLAAHR